MMEMARALSEEDPSESPDHKRHMAESLGCEKFNLEAESKNEILFKLWIQHVDNNLQEKQKDMLEQDFRETDISFEPWYVTKGEHLEYPHDWKNWKTSTPLKTPHSTKKLEVERQKAPSEEMSHTKEASHLTTVQTAVTPQVYKSNHIGQKLCSH